MQYYLNVKLFTILILHALILQGGDNIEILPNPSYYCFKELLPTVKLMAYIKLA